MRSVIDISRAKCSKSRTLCADDFKRVDAVKPRSDGIANEDKTTINVSTIIISINVKAASELWELRCLLNPVCDVGVMAFTSLFAIPS